MKRFLSWAMLIYLAMGCAETLAMNEQKAGGTLIWGRSGDINTLDPAKAIGAESCNGWTFWHYQSGNSLKPIDELRQRLRASN